MIYLNFLFSQKKNIGQFFEEKVISFCMLLKYVAFLRK